jgi:acylphosphatase
MAIKQARIILKGKVQGVFFRDFAKQNANKMGIVGYARNTKEGTVEIVAQGEERKLEDFIRLCKKGPIFAKVESADVSYEAAAEEGEYEYFDIRHG